MKKLNYLMFLLFMGLFSFSFTACEEPEEASPITACFNASSITVAAGESVHFTSCSDNAESFAWDFGDGATSTDENPDHVFTTSGNITVKLTVKNGDLTDDVTKSITVIPSVEVVLRSETITSNTTWVVGTTYVIDNYLNIEGATLTIQPGAIIKFKDGAKITVGDEPNSALIANGTAILPITFTSYSTEPSNGDWDFISFENGTLSTSSLTYCNILYAGAYASYSGAILINDCKVNIKNCNIEHSSSAGIVLDDKGEFKSFTGNTIKDCGTYDIVIFPNYAHTIGTGNVMENKGILLKADNYSQTDATWLKQTVPYVVDNYVYVKGISECILRIEAGATIAFNQGASMSFANDNDTYATLIAEGTANEPITFTSASVEKSAGDWNFLSFEDGTSANTSLKYCVIEYAGGFADYSAAVVMDKCKIAVANCTIQNSNSSGFALDEGSSFTSFTNNTIENISLYAIKLHPNHVHTVGTGNNIKGKGILILANDFDIAAATWLKQTCPYIVDNYIYIGSTTGSILTIEAGTTIAFAQGANIRVGDNNYATLIAQGTATEKITFTSAAPTNSKTAGDHHGLFFYNKTSTGSIIDNCILAYGGGYASSYNHGNINCKDVPDGALTISNNVIKNSAGVGIYIDSCNPTLTDNTFENNASTDTEIAK